MKTLKDVKQDMSELYEQVKSGAVDVKTASELANITGKFLKAEQLELAKAVFLRTTSTIVSLTNDKTN
jgi:predicted metallo-beta-lactamase superfamily hydrolase